MDGNKNQRKGWDNLRGDCRLVKNVTVWKAIIIICSYP